jgi:hypothetical protein
VNKPLRRQFLDAVADGNHLRKEVAEDSLVPVLVDLTDAETDKVLATFDPLGGMALIDDAALGELLGDVEFDDNAELRRLMTGPAFRVGRGRGSEGRGTARRCRHGAPAARALRLFGRARDNRTGMECTV